MKRLFKAMILVVSLLLPLMACEDNGTGVDEGDENNEPATLKVENQGTNNGNQVTIHLQP